MNDYWVMTRKRIESGICEEISKQLLMISTSLYNMFTTAEEKNRAVVTEYIYIIKMCNFKTHINCIKTNTLKIMNKNIKYFQNISGLCEKVGI